MNLTRKRWQLLAVSCLINLFAGSIYAWSVFAAPLAQRLSEVTQTAVSPSDLALAFSIANGIAPIPMIFGGAVNDRFGPRFVIMAGGLLMGLGLAFSGRAESITELTLVYGLSFGLGLGLVYGSTISSTMKFFPDHRGLVGGLTTAFYGISSVLVPPVATKLIAVSGISTAMALIGFAVAVVIVAGGMLSMRCPPDFVPNGAAIRSETSGGTHSLTWRRMLADPRFPPMMLLLMCGATAGMMVISQGFTIARTQMNFSTAEAALAVSFVALANTAGRLCAGTASDYLGRTAALCAGLAVALGGLGLLALSSPEAVVFFYLGLLSLGFSFGCFMGVYPGFTAQVFGPLHNGVNFGIMFVGFSCAGLLGPLLMKTLLDQGFSITHGYAAAALVSALGFAAVALYRRASERTRRSC